MRQRRLNSSSVRCWGGGGVDGAGGRDASAAAELCWGGGGVDGAGGRDASTAAV